MRLTRPRLNGNCELSRNYESLGICSFFSFRTFQRRHFGRGNYALMERSFRQEPIRQQAFTQHDIVLVQDGDFRTWRAHRCPQLLSGQLAVSLE